MKRPLMPLSILVMLSACGEVDARREPPPELEDAGDVADAAAGSDAAERDAPGTRCEPGLPGPPLVLVEAGEAAFCIDAHEVTQRHYAEFLAAAGDEPPPQLAECAWNERFDPIFPSGDTAPQGACLGGSFDPLSDASMGCVDWCDAKAYCEWAGKRLCDDVLPLEEAPETTSDWQESEWQYACTAGGGGDYPYGTEYVAGRCVDANFALDPPGHLIGSETCTGAEPPFDGIRDLVGNVAEWTAACQERECHIAGACDYCAIRGGASYTEEGFCNLDEITNRSASGQAIGIRCCADLVP